MLRLFKNIHAGKICNEYEHLLFINQFINQL